MILYNKKLSGIYIIEKKGYAKGYKLFTNKVIFEGEYLNGKKIKGKQYNKEGNLILKLDGFGKGKEYYKNDIINFKGEYLDTNRWNGKGYNKEGKEEFEIKYGKGFIKEYNYNGILKFEGEYLNGERNGKGKEYNDYGNLIFEGEYLNGVKWNGKGKE